MQTTEPTDQGAERSLNAASRLQRAVGVGLYVAVLSLAYLWPASSAGGVTICPFRRIFGLSCFGCGMTRGWTALLHGEWLAAVTYHPFAPVLLIGLGLWAGRAALEAATGRVFDMERIPGWKRFEKPVLVGALVFVVIFGLLRVSLELMGIIAPV